MMRIRRKGYSKRNNMDKDTELVGTEGKSNRSHGQLMAVAWEVSL